MILKIHEPIGLLSGPVKSIICYKGYTADHNYEKLLPDGYAQLVITLDDAPRFVQLPNGDWQSLRGSWITGIQTSPIIYKGEVEASTVCVQLRPSALYSLLKLPSLEFSNQVVESADAGLNKMGGFREKLLHLETVEEVIEAVEEYLLEQLIATDDQYFLEFVKKKLCEENMSMVEISNGAGYSQKHTIHKFKSLVGLSPKRFQKLYRINKAIHLMLSTTLSQSTISQKCHYFDQAHFINDFRSFTSLSPVNYLLNRSVYPHVVGSDSLR